MENASGNMANVTGQEADLAKGTGGGAFDPAQVDGARRRQPVPVVPVPLRHPETGEVPASAAPQVQPQPQPQPQARASGEAPSAAAPPNAVHASANQSVLQGQIQLPAPRSVPSSPSPSEPLSAPTPAVDDPPPLHDVTPLAPPKNQPVGSAAGEEKPFPDPRNQPSAQPPVEQVPAEQPPVEQAAPATPIPEKADPLPLLDPSPDALDSITKPVSDASPLLEPEEPPSLERNSGDFLDSSPLLESDSIPLPDPEPEKADPSPLLDLDTETAPNPAPSVPSPEAVSDDIPLPSFSEIVSHVQNPIPGEPETGTSPVPAPSPDSGWESKAEAEAKSIAPDAPVEPVTDPGEDPPAKSSAKGSLDEMPSLLATPVAPLEVKEDLDDVLEELTQSTARVLPQPAESSGNPPTSRPGESTGYVRNEYFISEGAEDPWILPPGASAGIPSNQKKFSQKASSKGWGIITTVFFFAGIFVLGCLGMTWLMRGKIAARIENSIHQKVEKSGYYVNYDGWTYEAGRGFVLQEVTVFEDPERVIPYAKIDNIGVNLDLISLIRSGSKNAPKVASFRESNLALFEKGHPIASMTSLSGEIELGRGRVDLDDVRGHLTGVDFEVNGQIRYPEKLDSANVSVVGDLATSSLPTSDPADPGLLQSLAAEVSEAESAAGNSSFGSIILRDPGIPVNEAAGDPAPAETPKLSESLPGTEPEPESSGRPSFAPREDLIISRDSAVEPNTTAEPEPVLEPEPLPEPGAEPNLIPPPVVTDTSTAPETIEVPAPPVSSSEPGSPPLPASGEPGGVRPAQLPALGVLKTISDMIQLAPSGAPPVITFDLDVDLASDQRKVRATGVLTDDSLVLDSGALKGIEFKAVNIPFVYEESSDVLTFNDFSFGYGDGKVSGNAVYGIKNRVLDLQEVRSTIDILSFLAAIKPEWKEHFRAIQFVDLPEILIRNGRIPFSNPSVSEFDFAYEQWGGMIIRTGEKRDRELPVKEIRGNLKLSGATLTSRELQAKILGGETLVSGSMNFSSPLSAVITLKSRGVPMENLAAYYGVDSKLMKGRLDLDYEGGVTQEISKMNGSGRMRIQGQQLYKVPVIGPIQRLLGAAIPVFGTGKESDVTGSFVIDRGILLTPDLQIRSDGTKILIVGEVDLAQQLTSFNAKANLVGPLGIATGLVGEIIEVEGRGALNSPQLRLKGGALPESFASESVKGILGIADGSAEALATVMREIAAGSGNLINGVGGGAVRTGLDAAGAIVRGVVGEGNRRPQQPDTPEKPKGTKTKAGNLLEGIKRAIPVRAVPVEPVPEGN